MHTPANLLPATSGTQRQRNTQKSLPPSRITQTLPTNTPQPVGPDYGCVEWYIYEEHRMRHDGT